MILRGQTDGMRLRRCGSRWWEFLIFDFGLRIFDFSPQLRDTLTRGFLRLIPRSRDTLTRGLLTLSPDKSPDRVGAGTG